jgi:hypothetical protein
MLNLHSSWARLTAFAFAAMLTATGCTGDTTTDAGDSGTDTGATGDTGSSDTGTMDTGSTDTGTSDTGPADTGSTDTGPSDTGSGGDAGGPTAACTAYCTTIMTNCTADNAQYVDMAACLGSCAGIPQDTATTGDTIGCHGYHATAAATDATVHCFHAGPAGGMGVCGELCENFCHIAASACPGEFATNDDCMTACGMWATTPQYSTGATGGDSYACRLYHLTVASSSAANAEVHCGHIVTSSVTCM